MRNGPVDMTEADLKLLMVAGMAGDGRAQSALLSSCAVRLRAYFARRLAGRDHDVEDLVQDTLIAIHTRRESYDPALPLTAWLYGIARYKLIDHFRRNGIRATVPIDDIPRRLSKMMAIPFWRGSISTACWRHFPPNRQQRSA